MRRNIRVNDDSIFVGGPHASNNEETEFAFGGELELGLLYRITRNVGVTAGYTLLFVDGIVRPNDAMGFSQAATGAVQARQATSELLLHSVYAGLQFNF
jgi:hypothetical protein